MKGVSAILGDADALELLVSANRPRERRRPRLPFTSLTAPATPAVWDRRPSVRVVNRATRSADTEQQKAKLADYADEEMVRTRKYWEKWAAQASKELLKTAYDDLEKEVPRFDLVYSGRCGRELKFKPKREDDEMSEVTDISLLSTSTLHQRGLWPLRKKKKVVKLPQEKPDWEKLAKERANKGILDKLIKNDASRLERYMQGRHAPTQNIIQKPHASDLMEQYDRSLVKCTAYTRGLAGIGKSCSTENVMSFGASSGDRRRPTVSKSASNVELQLRFASQGDRRTPNRTPSPQVLKRLVLQQTRPESAVVQLPNEFQLEDKRRLIAPSGPLARPHTSPYSVQNDIPEIPNSELSPEKAQQQETNSAFIQSVHRRMRATVNALERATGFGDKTNTLNSVVGEKGRYTSSDYARIARYPQNIRIAPQLGKVIKDEIQEKMGKPRRHAIRVRDVKQLEAETPKLGRSVRNMIIFNWLNEMEPFDDDIDAPEIYDLEGKEMRKGQLGIMSFGDVNDVVSTITSRSSSAFSSLYSGRVSEDEEDDGDLDGLSMATGSACYASSAGDSLQG